MSRKVVVGSAAAVILLAVLVVGIWSMDWEQHTEYDTPQEVPTIVPDGDDAVFDENGDLKEDSLAYTVFEKYGIVLLPLALLMFGAMIGGVCISREEVESDDTD